MDQLSKLIEQYEENPTRKAIVDSMQRIDFSKYTNEFVEWLASRPTCGIEQRLFLDEIEKDGEIVNGSDLSVTKKEHPPWNYFFGEYFNCDFNKVINGE